MIAKILICLCYKEEFQAGAHECIKRKIHFYCKCQENYIHYVLFCKDHPFGAKMASQEIEKCLCKDGLSHEVCGFCLSGRYLLNLKCFKICVEKMPDEFIEEAISFSYYLKQINCDPFFSSVRKIKWLKLALITQMRNKFLFLTDH